MRLIDADKLEPIEVGIDEMSFLAVDYEDIKNAPTIEPKQEWIPCSERLPARQGYYICTCKDGSRVLKTTTIKWSNGWQLSGTRAYWKVIAWMPLPEPWEGADDEY